MTENYYRDIETVGKNLAFPANFLFDDIEASMRLMASVEVFRRLPEDAFQKLEEIADTFDWFIPRAETKGEIVPFPTTFQPAPDMIEMAKVLYLSPNLERSAFDINVAVIAHELAHIIRGHKLFNLENDYSNQEEDAWQLARDWGFDKEIAKHEANYKRRETNTNKLFEKLKRERGA